MATVTMTFPDRDRPLAIASPPSGRRSRGREAVASPSGLMLGGPEA
jgi:hypothetical protein